MKKHIYLGLADGTPAYATVELNDGKLSITGVIGPKRNGDASSCGQIWGLLKGSTMDRGTAWDDYQALDSANFAKLLYVWKNWHLNDMRAGCEHQRRDGWDERPIDPTKPLDTYIGNSWNMLVWVTRKEHPQGLLGEPCPMCGYRYGSKWVREELPTDVVEFLESLPSHDIKIGKWFE